MFNLASHSVKFLRDENVKRRLEVFLKEKGIDIISKPKGISNGKLAEFSKSEQRIIITNDKHFTDSSIFPKDKIFSVIWLKIPQHKTESLFSSFSNLLEQLTNPKDFEGNVITLYENGFEISQIPAEQR